MSDTPRTDAAQFEVEHATMPSYALVGWELARSLERELRAAIPQGWHRKTLEAVLKGLRSEDDSQQLRAIIAQIQAMLAATPAVASDERGNAERQSSGRSPRDLLDLIELLRSPIGLNLRGEPAPSPLRVEAADALLSLLADVERMEKTLEAYRAYVASAIETSRQADWHISKTHKARLDAAISTAIASQDRK